MANGTGGSSVSTTAAVSGGTVGSVLIMKWVFACLAVGHFVTPDDATGVVMAGAVAPFLHSIRNGILAWVNRKVGETGKPEPS